MLAIFSAREVIQKAGEKMSLMQPSAPTVAAPLLSVISPFLYQQELTDLIIGPAGTLWAETQQRPGLHRISHLSFSEEECRELAVNLAHAAGTRLDDAHPWADGYLHWDEGIALRIHAVLPAIAPAGTTISLRVLRPSQHTLADLVARKTLSTAQCAQLVSHLDKHRSMLITGATGTGKTTLLAALLATLPETDRIVTIEDTPELAISHPQLVQLVTRTANTENIGRLGMDVLLRQALRMRPDRLVVGEVRGKEIVDLLNALNTGHRGALASLHANSPRDVPQRILGLALAAGMPASAIREQMRSGIDVVVHLWRDPATGLRTVAAIEDFQC